MDSNERRRRGRTSPRETERTGRRRAPSQPEKNRPPRRRTAPRRKDPDAEIVYTPSVPFNRGKFVLRLATVVAVVLALLFGMSIFFKVANVTVSGNQKYTAWDIRQAAGIQEGENLLTLSKARVSGNIISQLPYVKSVRIGIKLPDTVNIEITELDVTYTVADTAGNWWMINDRGRVVDQTNAVTAKQYTQILGITIEEPTIGLQAVAKEAEVLSTGTQEDAEQGTTTAPAPQIDMVTGAQRLDAALAVAQQLSNGGLTSRVNSVDVTNVSAIEMWYEDRFQVNLGDTSQIEYKINALVAAMDKMAEYASGHLDISFTTWPDQIGYTPFT